ncbi:F420-dependent oxidoreductase [Amycolatopsis antarctica]|uniref:F420-dependent oxidoreductase n=1 Tax=Amycolatopsis antarctica TaxID=1854586 RepID=A0A263CZH2_9PSEU|nr:LLM class F420-dependent oxidoreductase [Amycolatopsis antarctica]OZM71369.1 F420-dependent oxidoreductase [Amycolatopsis antarctica]
MTERAFRFGVNMVASAARDEWVAKCRLAESMGYDVVTVADHLGMPPPFPAMVLAAEATEHVRVGTFVLNAAFYNPTLLAREITGTDQFTGGRTEIGLGAGYVREEFETAGIPWPGAGERVDHLERTVARLRELFADESHQPRPVRPEGPPLLLGGRGDRMLRLAARTADVVGFTGVAPGPDGAPLRLADAGSVAERVDFARTALAGRDAELNVLVQRVVPTADRTAEAAGLAAQLGDLTAKQVLDLPTLLIGTPEQIAGQVRANRERFGFSYVTVLEDSMAAFAPVIELLR